MAAFLEYIPLVFFFVFFKMFDIYVATGALIVASAVHLISLKVMKKPVLTRQWVVFGFIIIFGGMTIIFHDDTFVKWKVSIINFMFCFGLLISRYGFKKNPMKNFLGEQIQLPESVWDKFNFAWATFFGFCALLNLYIAYNFDQDTWVNFKVFGLMTMTFVFAIGSIMSIYKYIPQEESNEEENNK